MPVTTEQMYVVFQSIDASLKLLVAHFGAEKKRPDFVPVDGKTPHQRIAPASDLDGRYGDPEVRYDPRDWTGDSFIGALLSQCTPEYLDVLAESFDSYADWADREGKTTNAGKPVGPYKRRDASRARGWAARLRAGWQPPVDEAWAESRAQETSGFPSDSAPLTDDDIPFVWLLPMLLPVTLAASLLC